MMREEPNTRREDERRRMKVIESFLTKNPCYKTNRKIAVQGIALYTVGCPQPSAKVFVHNWNHEKYNRACAHAFIDANDGYVYQTLPWNHRGWHGDANCNNTRIGIMLCEPNQIKYRTADTFDLVGSLTDAAFSVERVYQSAVELCGQLCVKYNLDPEKDIWAPSGGHADPEHLWNGLGLYHTMTAFCKDVAEETKRIRGVDKEKDLSEHVAEEPLMTSSLTEHAEPVLEITRPIMRVRVAYDNLRIRSGPGTNCATTGAYTGKGDFDITEIQNGTGSKAGWGKLADGSGWISLDFAERL